MRLSELETGYSRTALLQAIDNIKRNIATFVVESELIEAALSDLGQADFQHYHETLKNYRNEIAFSKKKLETANNLFYELPE
jgi:hypothetical protein